MTRADRKARIDAAYRRLAETISDMLAPVSRRILRQELRSAARIAELSRDTATAARLIRSRAARIAA